MTAARLTLSQTPARVRYLARTSVLPEGDLTMTAPLATLESRPPGTLEGLGMPTFQSAPRLTEPRPALTGRVIARLYYLALSAASCAAGDDLSRIVDEAGGRLEDLSNGHG